jgi:predicted RNA binding protein YcfA (HicA-like mRNA interferase family)
MTSKNNYRRAMRDLADEQGWAIERTRGGHLVFVKEGQRVFASHSPRVPEVALIKTRGLLEKAKSEPLRPLFASPTTNNPFYR